MSEIDKNFDIFNFAVNSASIPSEAYWVMSSVVVERLPIFGLQNDSKSTQVAQKRRC